MHLSIRSKILIVFAATLFLASGVSVLLTGRIVRNDYKTVLHSELLMSGSNLKSQLQRITSLGIDVRDIDGFDSLCSDLVTKYEHLSGAMIIDSHGNIIFHSTPDFQGTRLKPESIYNSLKTNRAYVHTVRQNHQTVYYAVVPLQEDAPFSEYAVVVSSPAEIINSKVFALIRKCYVIYMVTFGTALLILLSVLKSKLTAPLANILQAIKTITEKKNLNQRLHVFTTDEIGQICSAFNMMLEDLQATTTSIEHLNAEVAFRKQAQQQAQLARKEAEEANRAKSTFLANMSHEIRTPMNSIIGFSQLLYDEELPDEYRDYLQTVIDSGKTLLCLINDILDFSKIEAGKMKVELLEFDLRDFLQSLEPMMQQEASKKDIEFKIRKGENLPENICSDPTRLRQCLINLINNAVKFTDEGHVYLHVYVSAELQTGQAPAICFDVEDTGIGIPKDKIRLIFQSFSQADGSTTRKYGGTGLGLTITQRLTELMGGQISVTSTRGDGSTFRLRLPLKSEQTVEQTPETTVNQHKADVDC